uniref:Ig-like domain-containing protein n=1 Tax=Oryzias sinensis TaxID=183150 RepID=A0A8C7WTP3_9TELE
CKAKLMMFYKNKKLLCRIFFLQYIYIFFSTAKHSLEYFCTAASGVKEFPEFVGVATVDKDFVGSCSMIIHRKEPKHNVIKKFFEENSKEMRMYFLECQDNERFYTSKHVLQQHSGCEWDDETGETKSFNQYAYDGEDFLKLDLLKHEWTALTEKALATKLTWENNKVVLKHSEDFYSIQCPVWLRKYMTVGREYLQRAVLPSVSLLQRSNSSLVSCHATGFFPDMVDLFWMKDGEEFHEDVEKGEILPNNDETFQMSIYLNTSSLPPKDWKKFSCVFQSFRNKKNITISLDKTKIRTNKATYVKNTDSFIRGWGVGAAVIILVAMGVSGSNMFKHLMNLQSCLLTQKFCSAFIYAYIIQFFLVL